MRVPTTQEREDRYLILEQVNMNVTRVTCVAGGIYRAPLLHSVDAFVIFSLNLGPIVPLLLVSRSERGDE